MLCVYGINCLRANRGVTIPLQFCEIVKNSNCLYFFRKVVRVDLVENDELLVIMSGKQPMIKLLPRAAISSTESGEDTEMIKIPETKGGCEYLSTVCLNVGKYILCVRRYVCVSVVSVCVSVISVCMSVTSVCFSVSSFTKLFCSQVYICFTLERLRPEDTHYSVLPTREGLSSTSLPKSKE